MNYFILINSIHIDKLSFDHFCCWKGIFPVIPQTDKDDFFFLTEHTHMYLHACISIAAWLGLDLYCSSLVLKVVIHVPTL